MLNKSIVFLALLWSTTNFFAQNRELYVKWTDEEIVLDGVLDEGIWAQAIPATDFWQHFPTDSLQAEAQTEVRVLQDEKFLYIGIIAHSLDDEYVIPSLRRDFRAGGNDNITILFDTFNEFFGFFLEIYE